MQDLNFEVHLLLLVPLDCSALASPYFSLKNVFTAFVKQTFKKRKEIRKEISGQEQEEEQFKDRLKQYRQNLDHEYLNIR